MWGSVNHGFNLIATHVFDLIYYLIFHFICTQHVCNGLSLVWFAVLLLLYLRNDTWAAFICSILFKLMWNNNQKSLVLHCFFSTNPKFIPSPSPVSATSVRYVTCSKIYTTLMPEGCCRGQLFVCMTIILCKINISKASLIISTAENWAFRPPPTPQLVIIRYVQYVWCKWWYQWNYM